MNIQILIKPLFALSLCVSFACSQKDINDHGAGDSDTTAGDNDTGGCTEPTDCSFGERCVGGLCTTEIPPITTTQGCLADSDCDADQSCAISSGTCVGVTDTPTPISDPATTCTDGETQPCGSKVGACEYGTQTCNAGVFGDCIGATVETTESCNGIDDDCDGQIDETDTPLCDDGDACTINPICSGGVCIGGGAKDCSGLSDGCNVGTCNATSGDCEAVAVSDGTGCSDGLFCTVGLECTGGTCGGGAARNCDDTVDCVATGTCSCRSGTCNDTLDICEASGGGEGSIINEGAGCDDGDACTVSTTCQTGSCLGANKDCSSLNGPCYNVSCNSSSGACERASKDLGDFCSDGNDCTVSDSCDGAGVCTGTTKDCSAADDGCNRGICNPVSGNCFATPLTDGTLCDDGLFCNNGERCQSGSCVDGAALDCSSLNDSCNDGVCDESSDACIQQDNGSCVCDESIDIDFDGYGECNDCDPTNGGVHPGATERCNDIDDNCDGDIDEGFDVDGDTYTICSTDPRVFDCNDDIAAINPGMTEDCGTDGTGNGIDDDCDGYIDETCNPCTTDDVDGDGYSECDGDCNDDIPGMNPGEVEVCDGLDTDCNAFTIDNCGVSETCGWPGDADICRDDLLCANLIGRSGSPTEEYVCTSFCNSSITGPLGNTCASDQTCGLDLWNAANVHGCMVDQSLEPTNTKVGGVACSTDDECRSNSCARLFVGSGQKEYCYDYCGSDAYCPAAGTVCRMDRSSTDIDAVCWPSDRARVGPSPVGTTCTTDSACDHGFCATDENAADKYCTEACCTDSDCPGGYTCSLQGDSYSINYITIPNNPDTCTVSTDCPFGMECYTATNECAWPLVQTTPMCLLDVPGQQDRPAGSACTVNSDCRSDFCAEGLNVCIDVCCHDGSCPTGLTCELQTIQVSDTAVTSSRVCMNFSTDDVLLRK